jgi:hypothetical protein
LLLSKPLISIIIILLRSVLGNNDLLIPMRPFVFRPTPFIAASSVALAFGFKQSLFSFRGLQRLALPIGAILLQTAMSTSAADLPPVDPEYPGTSVVRLQNIHTRVKTLTEVQLSGDWEDVRRKILWAGGLKDLPFARPGQGYTGHSFNDFNHVRESHWH